MHEYLLAQVLIHNDLDTIFYVAMEYHRCLLCRYYYNQYLAKNCILLE